MKIPFLAALRDAEIARLRQQVLDTEARHDNAEGERRVLAARNAVLHAANIRLEGRVRELGRRLDSAHDTELGELADVVLLEARAVRADARVQRLLKVIARGGDALRASRRRADLLQSRLDDACGLNSAAIEKRRIVQASPAKEDVS